MQDHHDDDREHYKRIEHVDVTYRTALVAGGQLPADWFTILQHYR